MATTLMPLDPATSPQRANRVLTISARLLPAEIVATRQARRMRAAVIVSMVVVVALLGSWFAYASYQTELARDDLAAVTADADRLRQQQNSFSTVVNVQSETKSLQKQLATLLEKDLRWSALLDTLSNAGKPSGIVIGSVSGQLITKADATAPGTSLPGTAAGSLAGRLTISGTAPTKPDLARYVDALGKLKVVANPYLTSASEKDKKEAGGTTVGKAVEFSMQLDITTAALGGRFSDKPKTGGK